MTAADTPATSRTSTSDPCNPTLCSTSPPQTATCTLVEYDRTRRVDKNCDKFLRYEALLVVPWRATDRGCAYVVFECQDAEHRRRFMLAADTELNGHVFAHTERGHEGRYTARDRTLFVLRSDIRNGDPAAYQLPALGGDEGMGVAGRGGGVIGAEQEQRNGHGIERTLLAGADARLPSSPAVLPSPPSARGPSGHALRRLGTDRATMPPAMLSVRYLDPTTRTFDESVLGWLLTEIPSASTVRLATGYFEASVLDWLEEPLEALQQRGGSVQALIGSNGGQTGRADLERLLNVLASGPGGTLHVEYAEGGIFHPKVFTVESPTRAAAVIGSSARPVRRQRARSRRSAPRDCT